MYSDLYDDTTAYASEADDSGEHDDDYDYGDDFGEEEGIEEEKSAIPAMEEDLNKANAAAEPEEPAEEERDAPPRAATTA